MHVWALIVVVWGAHGSVDVSKWDTEAQCKAAGQAAVEFSKVNTFISIDAVAKFKCEQVE